MDGGRVARLFVPERHAARCCWHHQKVAPPSARRHDMHRSLPRLRALRLAAPLRRRPTLLLRPFPGAVQYHRSLLGYDGPAQCSPPFARPRLRAHTTAPPIRPFTASLARSSAHDASCPATFRCGIARATLDPRRRCHSALLMHAAMSRPGYPALRFPVPSSWSRARHTQAGQASQRTRRCSSAAVGAPSGHR